MARTLRYHGKTCHKKGEQETRGKISINNPLELRSEEADNRSVIGYWEGDTVAGKTGLSCLIDRSTFALPFSKKGHEKDSGLCKG